MGKLDVIKNANLFKIAEETSIVILGGDKIGHLVLDEGNCYLGIKDNLIAINLFDYVEVLDTGEVYSKVDALELPNGTWIRLLNDNITGKLLNIKHERYILKEDNSIIRVSLDINKKVDVILMSTPTKPKGINERLEEYKRNKRNSLDK